MARTAVHVTTLTANALTADPAGTTVDTSNNHVIAAGTIPEQMFIRVHNTHTSPHNVTVKAGAYPPALMSGQGDLVVAAALSADTWIGPLTGQRFLQKDGTINVDLAAGITGAIEAFVLPRTA